MRRRRGSYLIDFRGSILLDMVRICSAMCLLLVVAAGCARPAPVVEKPPKGVVQPVEALEVAPPETEELRLAFSKADSHIKAGQLEEATLVYKEAIKKMPQNAELHYNLGNVYLQRGLVDEAIVEYSKALAITPGDKDLHVNLGTAYYQKGMVEEAIGEYKKALAIDPDDPEAHYNLGVACEEKGLQAEAEKEFDIYQRLTGKSL